MLPSQEFSAYWIEAYRDSSFFSNPYSGKWLIFVDVYEIDAVWLKVKKALKEGLLGPYAKVSTMRKSKNAHSPDIKVICVFTENYRDIEDVMRIRNQLREMGFTQELKYKTDAATLKDNYGPDSYLYTA